MAYISNPAGGSVAVDSSGYASSFARFTSANGKIELASIVDNSAGVILHRAFTSTVMEFDLYFDGVKVHDGLPICTTGEELAMFCPAGVKVEVDTGQSGYMTLLYEVL